MTAAVVYHFSEDPAIRRFEPHVPRTNPRQPPAVWAIDADHAPLYWFPRNCPRVTVWPRDPAQRAAFEAAWQTRAHRVHAIEAAWLGRLRDVRLYRYELPAAAFEPWPDANGHWVAREGVDPVGVGPVGDLLALHAEAGIELRVTPSLWPVRDHVVSGSWSFSMVRMANAAPRS